MEKKQQSFSIHSTFEHVSWDEIENILHTDCIGKTDTAGCKAYIRANYLTYYVCVNTWLQIVEDSCPRLAISLQSAICRKGLIAMIASASDAADQVISNLGDATRAGLQEFVSWGSLLAHDLPDKQLLQILRYPKRLSVAAAPWLAESTKAGLIASNKACKEFNESGLAYRNPFSFMGQITSMASDILRDVFRNFSLYYDEEAGSFSSGFTSDAGGILLDKVYKLAANQHFIYDRMLPLPFVSELPGDSFTSEYRGVPKTYKSYRPIAMESAYRQFHMQAIRRSMERCVRESKWAELFSVDSQEPSREYCFIGAMDGTISTIDLSGASDHLSRSVFVRLFPRDIVDACYKYIAKYVSIDGKKYRLHMFSTAGAAVTFIVEDAVFFSLALATTRYVRAFYPILKNPRVFGDDISLDSRVAETLVYVLEQLGFRVSTSKSFISMEPGFREACGAEYVGTDDVTSVYYPRKYVSGRRSDPECIASLCSLQHRLFHVSGRAAAFTTDVVLALEPRMTAHSADTDCDDLWGDFPVFRRGKAPAKYPLTERERELAERRQHLCLVPDRSDDTRVELLISKYGYSDRVLLEHYHYAEFLAYGPRYEDELSKLLGVSTSRLSPRDYFREKVKWAYVQE